MIRRLSAMTVLAAMLVACSGPKPAPAPPPEKKTVTAPAPVTYTAGKSATLDAVRKRGHLVCGVHAGLPGFALRDARGEWRGFDVDLCRAVAAATLGDAAKVKFVVVDAQDRFGALQKGQLDLLSRNTSQTFARDAGLGLSFPVITYHDGQGFMVSRTLGVASAEELSGARVCVQEGTASAKNLEDYFRVRGMNYRAVMADSEEQARKLYETETFRGAGPQALRDRDLRCLHGRRVGPGGVAIATRQSGGACDPAGRDLQGTVGPGRAA